jgi:hypothetical protein
MPKEKYEALKVKCDKCGTNEDTGYSTLRKEWGELNIEYKGHFGSRDAWGNGAGEDKKGKIWLCLKCSDKFFEFLKDQGENND